MHMPLQNSRGVALVRDGTDIERADHGVEPTYARDGRNRSCTDAVQTTENRETCKKFFAVDRILP
jgi:hypothetical protein